MKKFAIYCLMLACVPFGFAQKTRYGQPPQKAKPGTVYPIKVHVSGIRLREYCNEGCVQTLHADAVLGQKKVELTGAVLQGPGSAGLMPGDYTARLLKQAKNAPAGLLSNKYELVLPGQYVWQGTVTGIFE